MSRRTEWMVRFERGLPGNPRRIDPETSIPDPDLTSPGNPRGMGNFIWVTTRDIKTGKHFHKMLTRNDKPRDDFVDPLAGRPLIMVTSERWVDHWDAKTGEHIQDPSGGLAGGDVATQSSSAGSATAGGLPKDFLARHASTSQTTCVGPATIPAPPEVPFARHGSASRSDFFSADLDFALRQLERPKPAFTRFDYDNPRRRPTTLRGKFVAGPGASVSNAAVNTSKAKAAGAEPSSANLRGRLVTGPQGAGSTFSLNTSKPKATNDNRKPSHENMLADYMANNPNAFLGQYFLFPHPDDGKDL